LEEVNRRSALALGTTVAAAPLFSLATPAVAQEYGPNDGKELYPGVRLVEIGTRDSDISAYKSIAIVDVVFQPGAVAPTAMIDNDMVCHITAGEFTIKKAATEYTVKKGDIYTCGKARRIWPLTRAK
jgi:hypothetical protein